MSARTPGAGFAHLRRQLASLVLLGVLTTRTPAAGFALPKWQLAWLVLLGLAQAATLVTLVLVLRYIVELLSSPYSRVSDTLIWVGILAGVLIINAGLRAVEFTVAERMGFEAVRKLRMTMYEHLGRMNPGHIQHRSRGALVLRFTGDLTMLRTWMSRGVARGMVAAVVLVSVLAMLALLDVWISLALTGTLLLGAAISMATGEILRRKTRWVRRKRSLLTSTVDEQIAALATVQVLGRMPGEHARMGRQNDMLTRALGREAAVRGVLRGISSATAWMALVAVIGVGAIEISRGHASVAIVVATATASRFAIGTVRDLGLAHDYWQRARVSRRKIDDFLVSSAHPPDGPTHTPLQVTRGRVVFEDVRMPGSRRGVNAVVEAGQVIALMGPTGSGKTTLLNLLARSVAPASGRVLVDGQDLAQSTAASLHRQISMVSPDLPLMRGTVRRNLTYRKRNVPEAELSRISTVWRLDEVFAGMLGDINTWVTEGGGNLSAGQRQRLAIARAMIGNPRILLLDDPSRSLDRAGREILHRVLSNYRGTVFMVTDDAGEAALADQVWLMDGGLRAIVPGDVYRGRLRRAAPLPVEEQPAPVLTLRRSDSPAITQGNGQP